MTSSWQMTAAAQNCLYAIQEHLHGRSRAKQCLSCSLTPCSQAMHSGAKDAEHPKSHLTAMQAGVKGLAETRKPYDLNVALLV